MIKRFATALVPATAIILGSAHPSSALEAKLTPGRGDFLYAIASGPTGSLEFSIAGRLAALAAMGQEGGPHGESGPRLTPLVEPSARQALADLLTQPSTDLAILPVPLLERSARVDATLKRRVSYVAQLDLEPVLLLVRDDLQSVEDLTGHPVAVDGPDSVGTILLTDLGVSAKLVESLPADPVAALRTHDVDAVVIVGDGPVSGLATVPVGEGLKLLPISYSPTLEVEFVPSSVQHVNAPGLVAGQAIDTVAVQTVLAVYLRPPNGERARSLWSLVASALDHIGDRGTDSAGRALGDVNWAAQMSGWQRLPAMSKWLEAQHAVVVPYVDNRKGR